MHRRTRCTLVAVILALQALWPARVVLRASMRSPGGQAVAADQERGPTQTRLADGRWLVVGERRPGSSDAGASLVDPGTGERLLLTPPSPLPRSGQTVTLLPDGRVLVLGGVDSQQRPIGGALLFDPDALAFEALELGSVTARAGHSTTVLSDGRVLVVGGLDDTGRPRRDAFIWEAATGDVQNLAAPSPHVGHRATLLPDGRVRFDDGERGRAELFDPATSRFSAAADVSTDSPVAAMTEAAPRDGTADVPLDTRLVMRFSRPLDATSVDGGTLQVTSEAGTTPIKVVLAEGGASSS
jgi:hypothetical protein